MFSWRERDNDIIRLATRHVVANRHFFHLFPSEQTAYRRSKILCEQGFLRLVGTIVLGNAGRPERIFCNSYKPKYDQLRHELLLTDFLLNYPDADTLRGWLVNRRLRPDAEMTFDGYFYYVELDTGNQSFAQVRRRQAVYAGIEDFVLYVTTTESRIEGLRRNAHDAIKNVALFTTLAEVQRNPRGDIWVDCQGERTAI